MACRRRFWVIGGIHHDQPLCVVSAKSELDGLHALRRRLQYELPTLLTVEDIANVSNSLSAMDVQMSKEWEDLKSEPMTEPPKK